MDLETGRVPLAVSLFSERGFTLRVAATYIRQKGRFAAFEGDPIVSKDDHGVVVDASLEYLIPRRAGSIQVGVNNLFDEFIDLLEIDPPIPVSPRGNWDFSRSASNSKLNSTAN